MKRTSERTEAACPNCSAALVIAASSRTRKMRCPSCRQVIVLDPPPAPVEVPEILPAAMVGPTLEEFAALRAKVERQAILIEKLLARVMPTEDLPPPTPPVGEALLSPGMSLRWLRRDPLDRWREEVDEEQESILLHNLRVLGQREVVMQMSSEHDEAQRLGERLSTVFRRAGWTVQGPELVQMPPLARGLVLAAGQCPPPKAATATYMALKAAGFEIDSRLDAALRPDQSVLIAGALGRG